MAVFYSIIIPTFQELFLIFETNINSANVHTPSLRGSLNIRRQRYSKITHVELLGSKVCICSAQAASSRLCPLPNCWLHRSRQLWDGPSQSPPLAGDKAASAPTGEPHHSPPSCASWRTQTRSLCGTLPRHRSGPALPGPSSQPRSLLRAPAGPGALLVSYF